MKRRRCTDRVFNELSEMYRIKFSQNQYDIKYRLFKLVNSLQFAVIKGAEQKIMPS